MDLELIFKNLYSVMIVHSIVVLIRQNHTLKMLFFNQRQIEQNLGSLLVGLVLIIEQLEVFHAAVRLITRIAQHHLAVVNNELASSTQLVLVDGVVLFHEKAHQHFCLFF